MGTVGVEYVLFGLGKKKCNQPKFGRRVPAGLGFPWLAWCFPPCMAESVKLSHGVPLGLGLWLGLVSGFALSPNCAVLFAPRLPALHRSEKAQNPTIIGVLGAVTTVYRGALERRCRRHPPAP